MSAESVTEKSNHRPRVSVIVPTYDHKDFIAATIESVLQQTFDDYEIVIADDASNDGTSAIVESYAQRYPNKIIAALGDCRLGIAGNFNRALRLASGEYIAWLGGDDLMLPGKLDRQTHYLDRNPQVTGCHHDARVFDEATGQVVGLFTELYSRGNRALVQGGIAVLFDPGTFILPSTVMVRRSACPAQGFDERLRYSNDWLFDIETYRHGRIGALPEVLGVYRRHSQNVTSSTDCQNRALEENLIVLAIVQARYPELVGLVRKRRKAFLLTEMIKKYLSGDHESSFHYMKAAWLDGAYTKAPAFYALLHMFHGVISRHINIKTYGNKPLIRKLRNRFKF